MLALPSKQFPGSHYQLKGHGPAILLVHGFAEDHHVWESLMDDLQSHYLVITPDLPGSGLSPLPKDEMSMELLADFLREILDAEQIDQIVLLGHSMGGYVMMAFMEKYPERVKGLGFIHSTSLDDDLLKKETRAKAIRLMMEYPNGKYSFLSAMVPNLFSSSYQQSNPEIIERHLTQALNFTSEALIAYYQAMMQRKNRKEWIRNTSKPVLFVIGSEDKAIPKEQNLQECYLPQKSNVHIMQDVGHMSMFECGQDLIKVVHSFLEHMITPLK